LAAVVLACSTFITPALASPQQVTPAEAARIAKNYVVHHSTNHFPAWSGAARFAVRKVMSTDDVVVSYEISIGSQEGESLGFVVVAAQKGAGEVVTAFSSEGESESKALNDYFLNELVPLFAERNRRVVNRALIGTATGAYAVGVVFDGD
jgi:hypothetical protein